MRETRVTKSAPVAIDKAPLVDACPFLALIGPRGFFVASSGVITNEAIIEYIRTQDVTNEDGDYRVEDE